MSFIRDFWANLLTFSLKKYAQNLDLVSFDCIEAASEALGPYILACIEGFVNGHAACKLHICCCIVQLLYNPSHKFLRLVIGLPAPTPII